MELTNNFIIVKNLGIHLGFLWAVLFGAILNFSLSGLFNKMTQKFSNFISIATLFIALIFIAPIALGFLNSHSLNDLFYFDEKLILNGKNSLYCFIFTLSAFLTFLTNLKFSKRFRHKLQYFNSLYLISTLCGNFTILANDFLTFALSLEAFCICTLFIIFGKKDRNSSLNSIKFLFVSLISCAFLILSFAVLNNFNVQNILLNSISQGVFIFALILKSGYLIFSLKQFENFKDNFSAFSFINLQYFTLFALVLAQKIQILTNSDLQTFFIIFFALSALISTLKATRAKEYQKLFYFLNCYNFCFVLLICTTSINSGTALILSILLLNVALTNAFAIFNYNEPHKYNLTDFCGAYFKNQFFSLVFAICLYVYGGILPSFAITTKIYTLGEFTRNGTAIGFSLFCTIISTCLVLLIMLNFASSLFKKPNHSQLIQKSALKKRTKLNYFVLFLSLIVLIIFTKIQ